MECEQLTYLPRHLTREPSCREETHSGVEREFLDCVRRCPELNGRRSGKELDKMFWDFRLAEKMCLAEPMDYLKYRFYAIERSRWQTYLTRRQYAALCAEYNRPEDENVVMNKSLFVKQYAALLGRDTVAAAPGNRAMFDALCAKHKKVMLKPNLGGYGRGIRIAETGSRDALWEQALGEQCVVEEVIEQHGLVALAHSRSVNTVRVAVLTTPKGEPVIASAVFRCGRGGSITDNECGIFADVDPDTGVIRTQGTTHFGERFPCHPDTGFHFEGALIPCWQRLRHRILAAAQVLPELRVINWDWALRCDGQWVLIEGNVGGGFGPCQEAAGVGLRQRVTEILTNG